MEREHQATLDAILELNKKLELSREPNEKSPSDKVEDNI